MKSEIPVYQAIAIDVAQRVANGEFPEGVKISGRSMLAGHYNVSPETIRRSVALLREGRVVDVSQGKEVLVTSVGNAYQFIEHYKNVKSVYSLRQDVEELLRRKQAIEYDLEKILLDIMDYSDRFRNLTPYNPVEIIVPKHSRAVGCTVSQLHFWQHTGATIVAIRRDEDIVISPGPDAAIYALDRIVVVGDRDVLEKTKSFLEKTGDFP